MSSLGARALLVACSFVASLAAQSKEDLVPVRGTVVDVHGRPIAGAGVRIGAAPSLFTSDVLTKPVARTDARGRIRFETPRVTYESNDNEPLYVLIAHAGYATARVGLITTNYNPYTGMPRNIDLGYDLGRITLLEGGVLEGRVRGASGRPLPGARVVARELLASGYYARFANYGWQQPVFESTAKTDARGRFKLTGVFPEGMSLTVQAPGYYDHRLPFVSSKRIIDVSMEKSGFVEGRVVDGDDEPVAALIYMKYETTSYTPGEIPAMIRTGKDGRFKVSLSARGRYSMQVTAILRPGEMYRSVWGKSYSRPRNDVEIELAQPADTKKPITVEVVDKKTGKPVPEARGVVLWQDPRYLNTAGLESNFKTNAKKADEDGKIELRGPLDNQPPKGGVLVKAEGYAPSVQKKIEYDEEKPPALKIELEKESLVRGVVVDEKTGKPLGGVRVTVAPAGMSHDAMMYMYGYHPGAGRKSDIVTDADGRFRIGGLGAGKYEVKAKIDDRPESKLKRLALKKGEERADLRLEIPTGVKLTGRVFAGYDDKGGKKPARLKEGWQVRLGGTNQGGYYDPWMFSGRLSSAYGYGWGVPNQLAAPPVVLGKDGSFEFEGLATGRYRFNLMAPPIGKRGRIVLSAIDPLRIRKKNVVRDFDISEDLPGTVRGKVAVTGVPFPMSRLFVLSVPIGTGTKRPGRVYFNQTYFRCVVEEDGTFAFRANKGRHHIYIMDGAYSTVLYHAPEPVDIEFGKTAHVELSIPLTRVRVRLRPETEGGGIVVGRMEWLTSHPGDGVNTNFGRYEQGYGQIVEGQTEFYLVLPPVKTQFVLRAYPNMIDPQGRHGYLTSGEGEVTPKLGTLETLEIRVRPPADLTNAAPPQEKNKKKETKSGR